MAVIYLQNQPKPTPADRAAMQEVRKLKELFKFILCYKETAIRSGNDALIEAKRILNY